MMALFQKEAGTITLKRLSSSWLSVSGGVKTVRRKKFEKTCSDQGEQEARSTDRLRGRPID